MPQDAKDIQFAELKDMIAQLNTTIAALTGTIQEKDEAIAKLTEESSVVNPSYHSFRPLSSFRCRSGGIFFSSGVSAYPEPVYTLTLKSVPPILR